MSSERTLDEYKTLRGEIDRNSQITSTVFLANVSVTAVLIGYGLSSKSAAIFLSPFAILIPSLFFIASQLESPTRIASYIKVFIEPELALNWETRWFEVRKKGLLPHRRKYTLSLSGLYGALSVACVLLAFWYWRASYWTFFAVLTPIAILVLSGISSLVRPFSVSFCERYDTAWAKLKVAGNVRKSMES